MLVTLYLRSPSQLRCPTAHPRVGVAGLGQQVALAHPSQHIGLEVKGTARLDPPENDGARLAGLVGAVPPIVRDLGEHVELAVSGHVAPDDETHPHVPVRVGLEAKAGERDPHLDAPSRLVPDRLRLPEGVPVGVPSRLPKRVADGDINAPAGRSDDEPVGGPRVAIGVQDNADPVLVRAVVGVALEVPVHDGRGIAFSGLDCHVHGLVVVEDTDSGRLAGELPLVGGKLVETRNCPGSPPHRLIRPAIQYDSILLEPGWPGGDVALPICGLSVPEAGRNPQEDRSRQEGGPNGRGRVSRRAATRARATPGRPACDGHPHDEQGHGAEMRTKSVLGGRHTRT